MKKIYKVLLLCAFIASSGMVRAQNGIYFGLSGTSANFWSGAVIGAVEGGINALLPSIKINDGLQFRVLSLKDNGERVDIDHGNYFGFKGKDLFSHIEVGVKSGWITQTTPVGVDLELNYGFERFRTRFKADPDYCEHRIHYLRPQLSVMLSPFSSKDWSVMPVAKVKASYVFNLKYSGIYGTDTDQLNNGFRSAYAAGVAIHSSYAIMLGFEMSHYNYFNQDYSSDGTFDHPFANTTSKDYNIFITFNTLF